MRQDEASGQVVVEGAVLRARLVAAALHEQLADPTLTNCRGAALLAFHRLGRVDLDAAGGRLALRGRYEPRAQYRARYDDMAGRFVLAHERLGPVFGGSTGGTDG